MPPQNYFLIWFLDVPEIFQIMYDTTWNNLSNSFLLAQIIFH